MSRSRPPQRHFIFLLLAPVLCSAQYGGGGYGDFGGGGGGFGGGGGYDYTPPAPICAPFKCPAGMKPAGNGDHKLWSYGCKDSGINVLSMADLDGLGGMNKKGGKNVDKCCVERDICKQTCGTTSKECHDTFQACSKKICKGDQNCNLASMMSDTRYDPEDDEEEKKKNLDEPFDYEKDRKKRDCRGYEKGQASACVCVPKDDWQLTTDSNLKNFYRKHNPEKLDDDGEIKDIEEVWKKWKGKEPQMFQALAGKYKAKAVEIKEKPKPPPYKPPPPLSKEEQEKEDKRLADQREKWKVEDAKRDEERAERERLKAEEKEEAERQKREEEEGEEVEL